MNPLIETIVISIFTLSLFLIISCDKQEHTIEQQKNQHHQKQFPPSNLLHQQNCDRTSGMPKKLRMENYRAPTPSCVPQGITIETTELESLIKQQPKPILIDVLSVITRPNAEFGEGQWIPNKERMSLPGSVWLPNVGYGYLDEEMKNYFKTQLHSLTQGDKKTPVVFFCIADCWMSWNAVQRASEYGYTNTYWYKNGTDGWAEAGLKMQEIDPVPLVESQ